MGKQIGIYGAFVLCWSSGFIGAKLGTGTADAVTLLMWRFVPLAVLLGAVAALRRRRLTRAVVARQAVVGLLSQCGYLLTVYWAIGLGVSSGTTALIDGTQPLVVGALAGPLLRERVSARQWAGLCTGIAGVALVTAADAGANPGVPGWAYAVPFAGMLALVAATFVEQRSPHAVEPIDALTVQCAASAVALSAIAVAGGAVVPPADASFWLAAGWLIVFATFGGYGLYWIALRRSGVTTVNALMFLMAPTTAVWGALMFGEPLGPGTIAGLLVALAAVAIVIRPADRGRDRIIGTDRRFAPPCTSCR
jgi:drug/metabolite transporter (DMT)-like permease